ncbi:uncharacterized protein B0I36DRAFT_345307 [Microdochium trichocladiopsis]|uniref:Protein IVY1 n=1 Tax=Microdochium trichocladiopsis TaxID=1682393 RepID=A0A9P8YCX1_9PEZI|nr:uncharacterized protein B0I36DRAFT_345307 [Microdochium trichocladiopsis]KAH7037145.1 hypothetical protein B0I36DRAFT_345307 [Microdochium trichocladiopsis]
MPTMASAPERPDFPPPSDLPPVPGSPTFTYASTTNQLSSYNLPLPPPPRPSHAVLTKADLEQSQIAYSDLIATAKAYRVALASLSTASSAFGCALEACARLKEARADTLSSSGHGHILPMTNSYTANGGRLQSSGACTADLLLSASGVHHLIANHQQILSETVYRSFEVPLLDELDKWRREMADEDQSYQNEVAARAKEIRRLEKEGLKLHKQRRRDLGKFREHLVDLTSKLDGLTTLQGEHSRTLLSESQVTSSRILDASCSLVRAEVEIFESLARKGWNGGGLDDLLEKGRDLFANEDDALGASAGVLAAHAGGQGITSTGTGAADGGAKLFSILPPKSILADSSGGGVENSNNNSSRGRPRGHGRADSLLVDSDRYQSLTGAIDHDRTDTESIFSEFNQSRGVRPFSPQPIRRVPTDVIMDPDSLPDNETITQREGNRSSQTSQQPEDLMDLCTPGFSIDEREEEDDEAVSPWKDEGLDRQPLMSSHNQNGHIDNDDDEDEIRTIRPDDDDIDGEADSTNGADTMAGDGDESGESGDPAAMPSEKRKSRWNLMG